MAEEGREYSSGKNLWIRFRVWSLNFSWLPVQPHTCHYPLKAPEYALEDLHSSQLIAEILNVSGCSKFFWSDFAAGKVNSSRLWLALWPNRYRLLPKSLFLLTTHHPPPTTHLALSLPHSLTFLQPLIKSGPEVCWLPGWHTTTHSSVACNQGVNCMKHINNLWESQGLVVRERILGAQHFILVIIVPRKTHVMWCVAYLRMLKDSGSYRACDSLVGLMQVT